MKKLSIKLRLLLHEHWTTADRLHWGLNHFTVKMGSWMKARVFALFWFMQASSFTIEATATTQQDSCTRSIKTLTAQVDKLQADIKAIARGLGLLNPRGTVLYPSCFQVVCYLIWYASDGKTGDKSWFYSLCFVQFNNSCCNFSHRLTLHFLQRYLSESKVSN